MLNKEPFNECCAVSIMLCLMDLLLPKTIKCNTSGACVIAVNMLHRIMVYSSILVML